MPAIPATLIPNVGQTSPATLELTAPGANNQALFGIQIRRMA
jgi:hypothetical protein